MPWTFNPFSGTFDQKGSGGGGGASYIDGEVAVYADLPLDGTAPLNSAWLVRGNSGVWPFNKPAGIYYRSATAGVSRDADYTFGGTLGDVFADNVFLLYDNSDSTRNLQFDLGNITTGTTRTLTAPNASGRIQVEGQPIGNTTPAAGTFTTLTASTSLALTGGIITGASNVIEQVSSTSAQTFRLYNTQSGTAGANFERLRFAWSSNVAIIGTEKGGTGSARALELQTDGATRFTIATNGAITCSSSLSVTSQIIFQGNANIAGNIGGGIIRLNNHLSTGFDRLQFGGGTTSFPALKRDSTVLQARLANDSDFCPLQGQLRTHANAVTETITADKTLTLYDAAGTAYKVPCVAA